MTNFPFFFPGFTEELQSITCPILLIWGEREQVFEEAHLKFFVDTLSKHTKFRVIRPEGMGHVPHLNPLLITQIVKDFITEKPV